ncbi:alternative sulfate transporter [Colletotrichum asianum]|uniref:Alternative sulfate transporter n=1 Tax=Colletotrichum asianum TaxID=702518 RepID=A0A8H3WB16_9PEZI|nr:alternative sulfate transporter [Colletotrichum asianum]
MEEEKKTDTVVYDPSNHSPSEGESWTQDEEKAVVRKSRLDWYLMPLLVVGFYVLQLDRTNISNALTDTLTQDLGITNNQVNIGNQLMLAGIVIAEIPSNLILQRVGAPVWLTLQVAIWGTIALTQACCTNVHSFYATRMLLGLFEGGFIPGVQYMLALFYKRDELALRTSIFYFGNYSAAATDSLIAAGILQMGGKGGLAGWQWLFVIEGTFTLLIFFGYVLLLPRSPKHTRPIHGRFDLFTDRERTILSTRIILGDVSKGADKTEITLKSLREAFVDLRLWLHMFLNILSLTPKGGLAIYGPTIIKSLGFSKTNANLLNAVGNVLVIILSYTLSVASDKTRLRGPWCIVAFVWSIAFSGALCGLPVGANRWVQYALFTLLTGGNALSQAINDAWLNINSTKPSNRSVGLAMAVMGSNLGGLAGQQLFQESDAPRYPKAFLAILLLYGASIPNTLALMYTPPTTKPTTRASSSANLSNAIMGGLQRFIAHRADARVPVLAPSLWAGYHCGSGTNGCLWTAEQVLIQDNRLNAIRQFISNNPQGAAAPDQVLGPMSFLPGARPQKMWGRGEVATVKEMLAAGKDYEEIGARLGRSDKSVQAKVIRMAKKENLGGKKWAKQLQQRAKDEETAVEGDDDDADADYEDEDE